MMRTTWLALALATTVAGCGGAKTRPNLPPPEYEDEPGAAVAVDASAPPASTIDAGTKD